MSILNYHHPRSLAIFSLLILTIFFGCTTVGNIHQFRGKGTRATFKADYREVFEAAKEAATMQGLRIKEENFDGGYLVVGHGVSLMSWGELVGIYFDTTPDDKETSVEVISKAKVRTHIFAPKWGDKFLETLRGLVREGR
ncbi:MAG: hypothetical protein A3G87_05750 [Omnitrophica bacterium RIFCSPLOWO2_12_FULL_50_11]|nr:MAG: hypothetical protein A3G87_05750 [Omnitrophica bacterium RIFCSPLOWO2_12_FULL_50_11]